MKTLVKTPKCPVSEKIALPEGVSKDPAGNLVRAGGRLLGTAAILELAKAQRLACAASGERCVWHGCTVCGAPRVGVDSDTCARPACRGVFGVALEIARAEVAK